MANAENNWKLRFYAGNTSTRAKSLWWDQLIATVRGRKRFALWDPSQWADGARGPIEWLKGGQLEWEPVDEGGGFTRSWQHLISTVNFENYGFTVHEGSTNEKDAAFRAYGEYAPPPPAASAPGSRWWRAGGSAMPIQCELLSGEALYLPAHWLYEEHTQVPHAEYSTGLVSSRYRLATFSDYAAWINLCCIVVLYCVDRTILWVCLRRWTRCRRSHRCASSAHPETVSVCRTLTLTVITTVYCPWP
jgi:hypothetical protein